MAKKRVIQLSVLVTAIMGLLAAAWPVYAADIDDALYMADVVATNTGGTATEAAVAIDINTQALIDGKYVTSDLLNTAIQTAGGSDVPYMPGVGANPWIYWLPSVGAYESKPYTFYCGGPAMQTGFYYFPGDGGMTTTDNDVSLELGNDFQIEQKEYIDTSSAADKNLVYKQDAFRTWVSSAGNISSGIITSLSPYSSTSDGCIYATNAVYATAQAAASGTVNAGAATFTIGQRGPTYPTVAASNNSSMSSPTMSHTVSLPSGISSGNLLLIFFANANYSVDAPSTPSGWTQLFQTNDVYYGYLTVFYRVATGSEGGSVVVTTGVNSYSAHLTYRITGYSGVPEYGTPATGTSVNPNPPSKTASWGSDANLWFAVEMNESYGSSPATVSSYPANYNNGTYKTVAVTYAPTVGCARRQYTSASDDPGTFTISASQNWVATTIVIRPLSYEVDRGFVYFDTSAIPDGVDIASATLYLYGQADNSTTDFDISIGSGMPTYPTDPLAVTDYNKTNYAGDGGSLTTASFNLAGYNAIPLNATGLTWINDAGTTKFCLRSSRDIAVTTPTGNEYVSVYATEQAGTANDPYLVVNYNASVTAACSNGEHTVKTTLSGGTLSLQIDSEAPVTTAFTGSVPDNGNNWSFLTNGSVPYMEYHKIWVGGTLVQHIVYERAATFQDQTVYNNDATPTFRTTTTDPDITAVFENFRPIIEMEYTGGFGGGTGGMLTNTPEKPPEMYGEEGEGLSHLPGAELLETMLEEGDIPVDFFWIWFCYGLAAIGVVLGYRFIRSSLLFPVIVGFAIILFFAIASGGEPIPLWTIIPYGLVSAGFIVSERVFGW